MRYDIWLPPNMPMPDQKEPDCFYWPRSYVNDARLGILDKELYIIIVAFEQFEQKVRNYDIDTLMVELRGHPDKEDQLIREYLTKLGKSEDDLTRKEFKRMQEIQVPVTYQDIEESLQKLENLGYIKKL